MTIQSLRQRLWRFIQFPLVRMVLGVAWLLLCVGLMSKLAQTAYVGEVGRVVALLCASFAGYLIFVRVLEQRAASELGFQGAVGELCRGVLLGAALLTLSLGVLYALGFYQVQASNGWAVTWAAFKLSLGAAVMEELITRGLIFRILEQWLGSWWALSISAALFGLAHIGNPGASVVSVVAIAVEAGVLLAAVYMLTRRLWFAMGLHFSWNFTQGGVFGVTTSGVPVKGYFESTLTGPPLWAGGAFGAEASLVTVLICLSAGLWILRRVSRQGGFMPGSWRRAPMKSSAG